MSKRTAWIAASLVAVSAALAASTSCVHAHANSPALRSSEGPYELEVLIDGATARTFAHRGESYVLGHMGSRYTLRVHNRSGRRVEAVVSVDGRDVLDGRPADYRTKRGYLIAPYGYVDIDGWRISEAEVAAFRFASVGESYAARTGSARDVGVIGVAIFPERWTPPPPPPVAVPYDYDYRPSPWRGDRDRSMDGLGARAEAPGEPAPESYGSGGGARSGARPRASSRQAYDEEAGPSLGRHGATPPPHQRPGLGTEFGEREYSAIRHVRFVRQNASHPATLLGARYNDRPGLLALGIPVDGYPYYEGEAYLRESADPFPRTPPRRYAAPPTAWPYE